MKSSADNGSVWRGKHCPTRPPAGGRTEKGELPMKYLTKKQKKMLGRIVIAAVVFAALFLLPERGFALSWLRAVLYLIPYTIVGWDVLWKALRNIRAGQVFDENFLMAVAAVGAFGAGEDPEAVAVMLF